MLNKLFYILIFFLSSLFLSVLFYYGLSLDSSIYKLIESTRNEPVYFWLYTFFTFGAIILFGANVSLLVYKQRTFGIFNFKKETGTAAGSVLGLFASACPICGATFLSFIGIAGGLASFPFYGLELKVASFAIMALPLIFSKKEILSIFQKSNNQLNQECENNVCPVPKNNPFTPLEIGNSGRVRKFKENNYRQSKSLTGFTEKNGLLLIFLILGIGLISYFGWSLFKTDPIIAGNKNFLSAPIFKTPNEGNKNRAFLSSIVELASEQEKEKMLNAAAEKVLPKNGFQSKIYLGDAILKLVQAGVIDKDKSLDLYESRGGLPKELKNIFSENSESKILLTAENASAYLNLFWPLGLANYMEENNKSPLMGRDLFNFASTGGWTLGKAENGGEYFNKFRIVNLTKEQERLAVSIAKNIYRPCCGNSAFFQDCNHGSAMLGLLTLGASQGLNENELYREALAFNSFWFPDTYIKIAVYLDNQKENGFENTSPKVILSKEYSSSYGFRNVSKALEKLNLLPKHENSAGCGV